MSSPYRTPALLGGEDVLRLVRGPRASRTLARTLAAFFVALVAVLALVPWQQNAPGKGRVIAYAPVERQQPIEAPVEGRISHWHVQEGSRVRKGDPIVEVVDNDPELLGRLGRERDAVRARIDAAKARVTAIDARVVALESSRTSGISAAESRARMAKDRVRQAEQAAFAAEAAEKTAGLNLERQRSLHDEGLTSKRALELAELDAVRTRADSDRARTALSAARSEEGAFGSDRLKLENDTTASIQDARAGRAAAQAEVAAGEAELARMDVRLARQTAQSVVAPRDGTILRVVARQGTEMVKAGDVLALLVPDTTDTAVELWVSGNDIALVRKGRQVRLQFEGWPAVQFSGWPTAAVGTYGGQVAFVDAADDGHGRFRVVVVPDGTAPWPEVRQGVRANGWVLLDRVRLGYELWRQANGFPPDYSAGAKDDGDKGRAKEVKP